MKDNVIDLEQRRAQNNDSEKLKSLKVKADLENVKLVISTSLLSVLILATVANSNILSTANDQRSHTETSSGRGVASVQTGTSAWEDRLAEKLAVTSLKEDSSFGRTPSSTEQFTFGALEGKYSVRFENGKVQEFSFAEPKSGQQPIIVVDRVAFLKSYSSVLPVRFAKVERAEVTKEAEQTTERYNLIDAKGLFVGLVEFRLDLTNRVLSMRYLDSRLAAN
jgi:hypothetical protein